MSRPLLCFVGMFLNEAKSIRATLESVCPHIDSWCVLDTGSTDKTQDIVREVMRDLPGALWQEPFVDFAASRNRALEIAKGEDTLFTLFLSGDETLEHGSELRAFLESRRDAEEGAYGIEMLAGTQSWTYPRIFRQGGGWKYIGRVQEIPVAPDGTTLTELSPGRVVHTVSDPSRRARRIREFDYPTLTELVNDESHSLAERAKSIFFLAEANAVLAAECETAPDGSPVPGSPQLSYFMASMALYWRAGQLMEEGGSAHDLKKAVYAYFYYFHIADKIGLYTSEEILPRLEALVGADPELPEVRFLVAKHAAILDARRGLFLATEAARVSREAYAKPTYLPTDRQIEWKALRIAADCARALKNEEQAKRLAKEGIAAGGPVLAFDEFEKAPA